MNNNNPSTPVEAVEADPADDHVLAQTLIEEVSIDGMCGVY